MKNYWIWFPGDFEIHEGMRQNFTREERGMRWPAYWAIDDCFKNVKFENSYHLTAPTTFTVYTHQQGYITINDVKYQINEPITLDQGMYNIVIYVFSPNELPTVWIEGAVIHSDPSWLANNYITQRPVGYSELFTHKTDNPAKIPYAHHQLQPASFQPKNGGLLIDFGKEINASLKFYDLVTPITVCYGESATEALDTEMCYYQQSGITEQTLIPKRAFRYLFIPNFTEKSIQVSADCISLPMTNHATFKSDRQLINQIWNASIRTFKLCSDLFYIDGIKRDRWIWGGDAYQDSFINQYSFFNEDVDKRTIIALRGHDEVHQHINTIVDYSMLWIISIYNHYQMTADQEFLKMIMPRMEKMMDYLLAQTNSLGFIYGRDGDWIFVDWSEMDKKGTVAAEQMFLLQSLKAIITTKNVLGQPSAKYQEYYHVLQENTIKYFWDSSKGAFIDSYESGKRHVTRHANILAILFEVVDPTKQHQIFKNVLLNNQITKLTTPYFKFFEQDALCKLGQLSQVYQTIQKYWGSMIKQGATTIWEEYDPQVSGKARYAMYGDPFGKSLCHAWGGSPVYLLGRYFMGLRPTAPGYASFVIHPHLSMFDELKCTLPIKGGTVSYHVYNGKIDLQADRPGGIVISGTEKITLPPHHTVTIPRD
ncbi:alpha-rhamnosidase [uncultured Limosilactobacillus sp.]|uniref:alpha-L-rhamnosidase-related protein n=1 Tax=uncultured Limosilactobacillus sp. TaxID=2837629 RepID=UPI0025FC3643|nr:alpha-rhamnosidase [uncultured Limosilactobacillus sp.]